MDEHKFLKPFMSKSISSFGVDEIKCAPIPFTDLEEDAVCDKILNDNPP